MGLALSPGLHAQSSDPWSPKDVIEPLALAKMLKKSGPKPLILQVGFERLYNQGHIPGSPYCGPASSPEGIERLKGCLDNVPKSREIILYCGCCPWAECPNIRPAFRTLEEMGYHNVKVLHIAHDFGKDWTQHGYPTSRK
jgi:Rhodanese-like domain